MKYAESMKAKKDIGYKKDCQRSEIQEQPRLKVIDCQLNL